MSKPDTWRDLLALLRDAGGEPIRRRGSHETWRLPSGATFTAVVHRLHDRPAPPLFKKVRTLVEAEAEVRRAS